MRNLIVNQKGATAIEYSLIAALISIAAIGAYNSIGDPKGGLSMTLRCSGHVMADQMENRNRCKKALGIEE